jgi:Domain of unknown function (DUF4326)
MPPLIINMHGHRGKVPTNTIYVGRAMRFLRLAGSKWANPFMVPLDGSRDEVINKYRAWLLQQPDLMASLPELRGKDLACWCAPERCHAEVLRELAKETP